jgi:heptaprenyl diphosphate synthase
MKYSTLRLISGAFIIVGILLSQSLTLRFCMTVFIIILALNSGRKFRLLPNLILLVSISLAHTLTPNGLVLFSIGSYPITLGSLTIGASKALLLISFIYASHYMMSTRPQIPGKLGAMISLQFYYFDQLTTKWHQIEKKTPLIGAIDQLLLGIEKDMEAQPVKQSDTRYVVKKDVFIHILHISIIILLLLAFSDTAKNIFPFISQLP